MTETEERLRAAAYLWVRGATLAAAARDTGLDARQVRGARWARPELFDERERQRRTDTDPPRNRGDMPPRAPGASGVSMAALGARSCRFPLWDDRARFDPREHLYCGADAAPGGTYCAFHRAVTAGEGAPSERDAIRAARKLIGARGA